MRRPKGKNPGLGSSGKQSGQYHHERLFLRTGRPAEGREVSSRNSGCVSRTRSFSCIEHRVSLNSSEPVPFNTVQAIENAERTAALGRAVPTTKGILGASENGDLSSLRQELMDALAPEIQRNEVAVTVGPDGLMVSLKEIGFFERGSAEIRPSSLSAFSRIAWLLGDRTYRLRIEGHTDNRPIHNAQFSDNWELSTARAGGLVRLLIVKYGFAPERLSAAGYAEYHPVAQNTSTDGRAQNRRVDIVILGKISPDQPLRALATPRPADHGPNPAGPVSDSQSMTGTPKPSAAIPSTEVPVVSYLEEVSSV